MSSNCLVSAWNSCLETFDATSDVGEAEAAVEHRDKEIKELLFVGLFHLRLRFWMPGLTTETHLRLWASLQVDANRVTFIAKVQFTMLETFFSLFFRILEFYRLPRFSHESIVKRMKPSWKYCEAPMEGAN